jgi:hypothetical protein
VRRLLDEAWERRDQLQNLPLSADQWSPAEYAPHLWRELNALLVEFELRLVGGRGFAVEPLRLQVEKHLQGLQPLATVEQSDAPNAASEAGTLVVDRLARAARLFRRSAARKSFVSEQADLDQLAFAVREVQREVFRLPNYVRWLAEATFVSTDDDRDLEQVAAPRIESLLKEALPLAGCGRRDCRASPRTAAAPGSDRS